jgi:predicted amidohydrolase YtcJ
MLAGVSDETRPLLRAGPVKSLFDDRLALRSVKLYADGALGSRGAALLAPYDDDPNNRGLLFQTPEAMNALVHEVARAGFQVNVHAIGDAANREVLDAFEHSMTPEQRRSLRPRVEHAQVLSPNDIPRFAALGVIASMQPTHATSDMNMAEKRIGHQRITGAYAWRTLLTSGAHLALGSDFPVESPNPFYGLHAAVTRQDHEGNPAGGWYPAERLTLVEALRGFTLDAAYAAHQEKSLGTLEPGKWADFILVDQDIFEVDPEAIWKTLVLETWVAGERVYSRSHTQHR